MEYFARRDCEPIAGKSALIFFGGYNKIYDWVEDELEERLFVPFEVRVDRDTVLYRVLSAPGIPIDFWFLYFPKQFPSCQIGWSWHQFLDWFNQHWGLLKEYVDIQLLWTGLMIQQKWLINIGVFCRSIDQRASIALLGRWHPGTDETNYLYEHNLFKANQGYYIKTLFVEDDMLVKQKGLVKQKALATLLSNVLDREVVKIAYNRIKELISRPIYSTEEEKPFIHLDTSEREN
jgi:hypothetical protein